MKKNFKFMLMALLALLGSSSVFAQATKPAVGDKWNDDNYYYEIVTGAIINESAKTAQVQISAVNGKKSGEITVPASFPRNYNGVPWTLNITSIAKEAFKDNTGLTKVTFPAQIEEIGESAFEGCTLLAAIEFETLSQLQKIGSKAFATTQIVDPDFTNCAVLPELPDLLFTDGSHENSYVKTIQLPTSAVFTTFGTALASLPNLESTNIKDTKIQIVKALAFDGTSKTAKKLKALELPGTVKTVEATAFQGSLIEDLTINVGSILDDKTKAIGDNNDPIYGTSTTVLKTLTLKGELKGKVSTNAFKGNTSLTTVDMSEMTFASKGQIMKSAFEGCYKSGSTPTGITSVVIGDINHNGNASEYTINDDAFKGCDLLATVTIGNIDTKGAIGKEAFGKNLATLTIGNVLKGGAIAAGAFVFKDANTTVTIGKVYNEDVSSSSTEVFGAGAFTFAAADTPTPARTVTVTIGDGTTAVDSKGKVFAAGTFAGTKLTTLTFNGKIVENGLETALVAVTGGFVTLNFNGTIETAGIANGAFAGAEGKGLKTINFNGELAPGAVADGAFTISASYDATKVPLLTVNYTSATHANTTKTGIPFGQQAFYSSYTAVRDVKLNVTNAALKTTIVSLQTEDPNDIIFRVMLVPEDPTNFFNVYGDNNNLGTSYARILLEKGKLYKIDRRPTAVDADGVDQTGITYNLYVTYKEEDVNSKLTTLNMLPMVSSDGFYYVDLSSATTDLVVIVKAQGTEKVADKVTKMWYEEVTSITTASNVYNGDGSVKVASAVVTNQQLRDGSGNAKIYTEYYSDHQVTSDYKLVNKKTADLGSDEYSLTDNNVYLLTNPANFNGVKAKAIDYVNYSAPFINAGNFFALGKKYPAAAARMTINWIGESDATAIVAAKTGKTVKDGAIYNLQGVRVSGTQKGIYIQNGKKFIVK